jgi:hypothetical protein
VVCHTRAQSRVVFAQALEIFDDKMREYGPAWLGLSPLGFADQIYIKAHRYRTLVHVKHRKIADPAELELYAIINYSILALLARDRKAMARVFDSPTAIFEPVSRTAQRRLVACYRRELSRVLELQSKKDHDYGSAWKGLSEEGLADILFAKTLRIKAMLSSGRTLFDDDDPNGIVASLRDLVNYSAFAFIRRQSRDRA